MDPARALSVPVVRTSKVGGRWAWATGNNAFRWGRVLRENVDPLLPDSCNHTHQNPRPQNLDKNRRPGFLALGVWKDNWLAMEKEAVASIGKKLYCMEEKVSSQGTRKKLLRKRSSERASSSTGGGRLDDFDLAALRAWRLEARG